MKKFIVGLLGKSLKKMGAGIGNEEILGLLEIPPSPEMGDCAFPCFSLSKILRKNPNQIAAEIKNLIGKNAEFEKIEASGAYVNFFSDRKKFAKETISDVLKKRGKFGSANEKKEKIMVEFSQPNTHKAFHVGHIRGTSLGESISRILEFCGNSVKRVNYSGDTGMHVAKWIWCYKKYHSTEKLKNDESWIASIYVDSVKRLEANAVFQYEVDEINRKIESREDKKLNELWKKTRKLSIDSWKIIYRQLNAKFDKYFFESEVEKDGKRISLELLKKGIAEKSDGAVIMDLKNYNLGVWVLLRSDGTVLYSAKDLALAEKKIKNYRIDKNIIVHGSEQNLHFQQLFKTLEMIGYKKEKFADVSFDLVRLPTGKMSSRTGENILYSNFIREITEHAKIEIKKREPKISQKDLESRALKISMAAVKYSMLKQSPNKSIVFSKEEELNFEGDTGPYILYSYARANSIIKNSKFKLKKIKLDVSKIEEKEMELTKKLSQFPEIVSSAEKNLNPAIVANYSYSLAQSFNEFYHSCKVLGSKEEKFRILLTESFRQVLENSLNLLGIDVLEKM